MGWAVPPPRPVAGQASAEYVALLAVVCAVVAGAAAVGSVPPIAAQVAGAVRHGICRVAGAICTPGEARAAGLAPCLVHARADRERLGGRVLVVKLRRGDCAAGRAPIGRIGGGVVRRRRRGGRERRRRVAAARPRRDARGSAPACSSPAVGRGSSRPAPQAARFVRRWGKTETLTGEARGLWPGGDEPPPPDSSYKEGGAYGELAAALGGRVSRRGGRRDRCGARPANRARRARHLVHRIDAEAAAQLGVVLGSLDGHDGVRSSDSRPRSCAGKPVELRVRAAGYAHFDAAPAEPAASRRRPRRAPARQSTRRRAARVGGSRPRSRSTSPTPPTAARCAASCALWSCAVAPADGTRAYARSAAASTPTARSTCACSASRSTTATSARTSASGSASAAAYERRREVRDLMRAWSLRAGGALQEREDCIPA